MGEVPGRPSDDILETGSSDFDLEKETPACAAKFATEDTGNLSTSNENDTKNIILPSCIDAEIFDSYYVLVSDRGLQKKDRVTMETINTLNLSGAHRLCAI